MRGMPALLSLRPPTTDPVAAYPDLKNLVRAVRTGDLAGLAAYQDIPVSGRYLAAKVAAELKNAVPVLEPALRADPGNAGIRTLLGAALIADAWRIRTARRARYVSAEQFQAFHAGLAEAEQVLLPATVQDPTDVVAGTFRITIARGLEMGQAEARRRYDQVARHSPDFLPAQSQLLQQLCPKWGGSFEAMYAFARERAQSAPLGALNGMLLAEAHVEYWFDTKKTGRWFGSREVGEELDRVAARSVRHADFQPTYGWVAAFNTFAFAYSLAGNYGAAVPYF
jgi:hypothetical protein